MTEHVRQYVTNSVRFFSINASTHLALLIQVVNRTTGPIVELGTGIYSTPFLHWACEPYARPLYSYENSPTFFPLAEVFRNGHHYVELVDDWDTVDLSGPWSIAFVDHSPSERRIVDIRRLTHAEYVVVHDTTTIRRRHTRAYNFASIHHLFKYRFERIDNRYGTTVFSNIHDVKEMFL